MPTLDWSRLVSASVVPVVIVSAGGLLASALYHRFTAVVTRVRTFHRERINYQEQLLRASMAGPEARDELDRRRALLGMLEEQTRNATRRARHARSALACILTCIGLELFCSVFVGLASLTGAPALGLVAAALFLGGLALAIVGVGFALLELSLSLHTIAAEGDFIAAWGKRDEAPSGD